jgi:hypothetical protein
MSTRGVIARATGEAKFKGVYHHADSYCEGLGDTLISLYRGHFKRDLDSMLRVLIDEAPCGWSTIVHKDFSLKPGYTWQKARKGEESFEVYSKRPDYRRPQRFEDHPFEITENDDTDCEFAYVFDVENKTMHVLDRAKQPQGTGYYWRDTGRIELDSDQLPDWDEIQCGKSENWSRCHHMAWKHFPQLQGKCDLGMQKFLGNEPLEMRDAIAVEVDGKLLKLSGSGGDSDFLNSTNWRFHPGRKPFPSGTWVATCIHKNGRRVDLPIARRVDNRKFAPCPGVTWIFPPTAKQPASKVVG